MEPEGSLTHSQWPANCSYPEPDQSTPGPPSHFLKIHFSIILSSKRGSCRWSLSLRFLHQNPKCNCPLLYACYMHRSFPWFDHPNNI